MSATVPLTAGEFYLHKELYDRQHRREEFEDLDLDFSAEKNPIRIAVGQLNERTGQHRIAKLRERRKVSFNLSEVWLCCVKLPLSEKSRRPEGRKPIIREVNNVCNDSRGSFGEPEGKKAITGRIRPNQAYMYRLLVTYGILCVDFITLLVHTETNRPRSSQRDERLIEWRLKKGRK